MDLSVFPYLFSYLFIFGCGQTSDSHEVLQSRGTKFFAMDSSAQLDTKEISAVAVKEGMVLIDAGEFLMGSPLDEQGRSNDEKRNRVRVSQPFWMKKFEVTQEEWNSVVPDNQKRGQLVYSLTVKILNQLCTASGAVSGHYSLETYLGNPGIDIYLEEAVFADGYWSTAKKPRNYKVNPQKFKDMDTLIDYLNSQNVKPLDRLDNLLPVSRVSYSEAIAYCWEKTQRARMSNLLPTPYVFRLPTEAEWEYACRSDTTGICGIGDGNFLSGENANINGSMRGFIIDNRPKSEFSEGGTFISIWRKGLVPISRNSSNYPPNAWGLYHMHGNVLEWCYDFYGPYPDENRTRIDPLGPLRGAQRVVRGGSFVRTAHESRSAKRLNYEPSYRGSEIGFRYILGLPLR